MTVNFLYITCPTHQEAQKITKTLLEERLIACANILPPITGGNPAFLQWVKAETANHSHSVEK